MSVKLWENNDIAVSKTQESFLIPIVYLFTIFSVIVYYFNRFNMK